MNEEDQKLVEDAQAQSAAFGAIYKKYQRAVFRFFWYRLHDVELAADFAQDTFLRAFRSLKYFQVRGYSYLTFLLRIARNVMIDHFRKTPTVPLEQAERLVDPKSAKMETQADIHRLWDHAQSLSEPDRTVLELFYRQQRSIQEIADQLDRSPNAVKLQLSRARQKLRRLATGQK